MNISSDEKSRAPATQADVQKALTDLGIFSENVLHALDVLSANRIAYHPLSHLALRMRMPSDEAHELLKSLEPDVVESLETRGEWSFALARLDEVRAGQLATILKAYRSDRNTLRESLGQQSEVLRLRDELAFSRDLMGTILSNVGEILIVDLGGTVLATSAFVERTLMVSRGASHQELRDRLTFDPMAETGVRDIKIGDRYLECHISDFVSNGKLVGRNVSIADVTEARELQRARERYEDSRKQLFSIIAHELQNPALGLQSFLQDTLDMVDRILVSGKVPDMEQDLLALKEDVFMNQRGQTLLNRVIGDIFDYVKLQRGQMRFTVESDVSLDYLLALCSMQCEPLCQRKGITLVKPDDVDYDGIPEVVGDSTRLVQVLNNLVKNAVKFTPANGDIVLTVGREPVGLSDDSDQHIYIQVADSGPGMSASEIDMVFKEYRGSRSDGLGLGLMISDLIIRAHGGRISIESQIGVGSVFRVALPVFVNPGAVTVLPGSFSGMEIF
ncbi:MAG: HAMP domain-containing histidine kinase [Candidatus Latescibacteria bacterium]|nr:HAMP domain-containing histidine kinase [Candidatus Latescibacterota bacterium]